MNFSMQDQNPGKKFTGIAFAVFVHAVILYAILHWLSTVTLTIVPQTDVHVIPDVAQPQAPLPMIERKTSAMPIDIPWIAAPQVPVNAEPSDHAPLVVTTVPSVHPFTGAAVPAHRAPVVDAKACETPEYPARAIRDELQGATTLSMLIGVDGRVIDSRIDASSGYSELDHAALAGLSRCKFTPGTVDGKPEQAWAKIRYVWKLK